MVIALYIGLSTKKSLIKKIKFNSYRPLYRAFYNFDEGFKEYYDEVIALYIGLSTTRFCVSCIYLSYILTHISFPVNIFLKKSVDLFFQDSRKAFI